MLQRYEKTIAINASATTVWRVLTEPELMQQWAGEPDMHLEIITNWEVGSPFIIKGYHHAVFENKGLVLQIDAPKRIQYSHLSSLSQLSDDITNYSIHEFVLMPQAEGVTLTLSIHNFPTETIYKHLEFYWNTTLAIVKRVAEKLEV
ncbi:MAG: SRPBCC domain-containing protein [Bacteroidota bacterium]